MLQSNVKKICLQRDADVRFRDFYRVFRLLPCKLTLAVGTRCITRYILYICVPKRICLIKQGICLIPSTDRLWRVCTWLNYVCDVFVCVCAMRGSWRVLCVLITCPRRRCAVSALMYSGRFWFYNKCFNINKSC